MAPMTGTEWGPEPVNNSKSSSIPINEKLQTNPDNCWVGGCDT